MADSEENFVKIPLLESLAFPCTVIKNHFKDFLLLVLCFSFITAICFLLAGRSFFCFSSVSEVIKSKLFCSDALWSQLISLFTIIIGGGFFVNRWQAIAFEDKNIQDAFSLKCVKKDLKAMFVVFMFIFLWVLIVVCLYWLNIRKPLEDWHKELLFFVGVSFFIVVAAILLLNFVVFYRFINGERFFEIKKTFWPIIDNIYVPFTWSLVYFVITVFLFQIFLRYFLMLNTDSFLLINTFLFEFCMSMVVYFGIAVIQLFLAFQEKHLFVEVK